MHIQTQVNMILSQLNDNANELNTVCTTYKLVVKNVLTFYTEILNDKNVMKTIPSLISFPTLRFFAQHFGGPLLSFQAENERTEAY